MRRHPTGTSVLRRGLMVFVVALFAGGAAAAENKSDTNLDAVQRKLESERAHKEDLKRQAADLRKEAASAQRERIRTARAIQDHEVKVAALADELMELARDEAGAANRLAENRVHAAKVMMALQRLARNPPEALLVQPLGPSDTVRSAILLRAAVPGIERRVSNLREDLEALSHARERLAVRRADMARARDGLQAERRRLNSLFAEKKRAIAGVEAEASASAKRMGDLAKQAKTLQDLMARIEKDRAAQLRIERNKAQAVVKLTPPKAPPPRDDGVGLAPSVPFSKARGQMPFPVIGRPVQMFGAKTDAGYHHKGVTFTTLRDAQVVAPYDGKIVYADTFRGYGLLLILDHGEGYHSLLAGMSRIDGVLAQRVLAGEPVGIMGRSEGSVPELYVELRKDGQPINPMPWLAARKDKGKG